MVSHWFTRHAWRGTLLSGLVILLTWGCKATDMLPEMRLTSACESVAFNWDGTDTDYAWNSYINVGVHCSAPYQYSCSCDASWVHVTDDPDLQRITIRADINTQASQRSAIIRVETSNLRGETTQLQIQVVQQGTSEILSQDRLDLAADRTGTHNITIFASRFESKIGITAPDWITCSTSYNTDNTYALRVKSYPNLTTSPREGEIVLTVLSPTESDTLYTTRIRVTQPGAAHSFIEQDQAVLNDAGDEITLPVYYTGQWECSSSVSWLKVEQRQGTTENQSVMAISASPSFLSEPRNGIIVVKTEYIDGWQFRDTVYVTQQGLPDDIYDQSAPSPRLRAATAEPWGTPHPIP